MMLCLWTVGFIWLSSIAASSGETPHIPMRLKKIPNRHEEKLADFVHEISFPMLMAAGQDRGRESDNGHADEYGGTSSGGNLFAIELYGDRTAKPSASYAMSPASTNSTAVSELLPKEVLLFPRAFHGSTTRLPDRD
jgi:hypothetical protein